MTRRADSQVKFFADDASRRSVSPRFTAVSREKPSSASSQDLARRAMGGSEAAFSELYHHLIVPTTRYLSRRTVHGVQDTEELAHLAVSTALQALRENRYDADRARFTTFVFGIATKLGYRATGQRNAELARRVQSAGELDLDTLQELLPDTDDPIPMDKVEAALACLQDSHPKHGLTAEERFVLVSGINGAKVQWQADQLDCGLATVHRRKQTALAKLRRCMAAKGFREEMPKSTGHRTNRMVEEAGTE